MTAMEDFVCSSCGQYHSGIPLDFGYEHPDPWYEIPAEEREKRYLGNSDFCVIDNTDFFIRGCLEIPVLDGDKPFVWGVWASLSQKNFERATSLIGVEGREKEPPYFGWLCTRLPGYPDTWALKTHVHTRPRGQRPFIELEPTEHPLALEQRNGITTARVQEIVEGLLHPEK